MALKGAGKKAIQTAVDKREDFHIGNISGKGFSSWLDVPLGRLENPRYTELQAHMPVYVIFSYQTPIAWVFGPDWTDWTVPDYKYTVTTTHHQNVVRVAIDNPGFYHQFSW